MEWWEWITWAVALSTGIGGLVLGLRAELRATRYAPLWALRVATPNRFVNQTGEDATSVTVRIEGAMIQSTRTSFALVEAGKSFEVLTKEREGFRWEVAWTRPLTGKTYVSGERWGARLLRRQRERFRPAPRS
jgi:hypothetical protein